MIGCFPEINFGMPSLGGRRLTVFNIVTILYYGESLQNAIVTYEITLDDCKDALNYCKSLKCQSDPTRIQYCEGCVLSTMDDGWQFDKNDFTELGEGADKATVSKDGKIYFLGSIQELEDSMFGKATWLMAESILNSISDQSNLDVE
jgi:uncharacterized protein (DUF433 family)